MNFCKTAYKALPLDKCTSCITLGSTTLTDGTSVYVYIQNLTTRTQFRYLEQVGNGNITTNLEFDATYPLMAGHAYIIYAMTQDKNRIKINDTFYTIAFTVTNFCESAEDTEYSYSDCHTIKVYQKDSECCTLFLGDNDGNYYDIGLTLPQ